MLFRSAVLVPALFEITLPALRRGAYVVMPSAVVAATAFAPAFAVVTPPAAMVMSYIPVTLLVTSKVTAHALCAAIVPPASARPVTVPPHVVVGVPTSVTPLGRAALNAMPFMATVFSFVIVIVPVELAPGAMLAGAKAMATEGPLSTVSVAEDAALPTASFDDTSPFANAAA